ncbi:MAG TPA: DNA repair protein RecO, partial [Candidatus Saccharimonadales bacterium]|nr:DNA repair protein RecO [Candidatus Saccharimonadales bacterium]
MCASSSPLMQKYNTRGIVLNRTNYGEADRIISFLTPNRGKVKAIAKGVRKSKSKLAGGIELFSISDIGVIVGRGDIDTLASSRLARHYGQITKELDRTELAYKFIKMVDQATEDEPETAYFNLLKDGFGSLDDKTLSLDLAEGWFSAQLLKLAGHTPNLKTENSGAKLIDGHKYDFEYQVMSFTPGKKYKTADIKFLRLLFSSNPPSVLQKVQDS